MLILTVPATARVSTPDISRLQMEAERGSIKEQIELGALYFAGRGVPQDEKRAAYWYERAANAGDPLAQEEIGYFYQVGIGVPRDPVQAARWHQRAAAGGLIRAKVNLAVAYLLGDGVRKDTAMAEELFRRAYAQGNGMAACYLGEMYIHGMGVERDEAAGERLYEAGAKLHDPRAQFQLATLLWQRHKDANETKRAIKLLRESAANGMVLAMHQLGVLLVKHPEMAVSAQEAPALFKEAAEAGEWRSSVSLGLLARDGMGVPVDPAIAYYHYRVAALQGGDEALKVVANDLDALSGRLDAQKKAAIDADAKAWYQNHHLALQFVHKDGGKWREHPAYAVAKPQEGVYAGRLIPADSIPDFKEGSNHRQMAR